MSGSAKVFIPFEMDQFYPETAQSVLDILNRLDYAAEYNAAQTDCGQLAFENGNWETAKKIGRKFLKEFASCQPILIPSVSVPHFIKSHYPKLFYNSAYHLELQQVSANVYEFCDFIYNKLGARDIGASFEHTAIFHDCLSATKNEAMSGLLSHVKGLKLLPLERGTTDCCGSNFIFGLNNTAVASTLANKLISEATSYGIKHIIVSDIACKLHLDLYLRKQKEDIIVVHIADVLASGWNKR